MGFGSAGRAGWVGRGVGRAVGWAWGWLCWARWLGWAWGLAVLGALTGLGVVLGVLGVLAGLGVVLGVGFGRAGRAGWVGRGGRGLGKASWVGRGTGRGNGRAGRARLGWQSVGQKGRVWLCLARWKGWAWCWAPGLAVLGALAGLGKVLGVGFGRAGRAGWVGRGFKVQKYTLEIQK